MDQFVFNRTGMRKNETVVTVIPEEEATFSVREVVVISEAEEDELIVRLRQELHQN